MAMIILKMTSTTASHGGHVCNSTIEQVEGKKILLSYIYSEFEANLAYMSPCFKQAPKQIIASHGENTEKWEPSYNVIGM